MKTTPTDKCRWLPILLNLTLQHSLYSLFSYHCYFTACVSPSRKQILLKQRPQFHLSPSPVCFTYFSYLMGNSSYGCPTQKSSVVLHGLLGTKSNRLTLTVTNTHKLGPIFLLKPPSITLLQTFYIYI